MKYALLLYDDPTAWEDVDEPTMKSLYEEYAAVGNDAGTYGGAELHPAPTAKTLRVQDGRPLVVDGPYTETKEVLSGLYLIEADSEEDALATAARIPTASRMGGAIEVRRIVER